MTIADLTTIAVDLIPCRYCRADAGDPCRVARGRTVGTRATYTHADRTTATRVAWLNGWRDGLTEALAAVQRARDKGHTLAQVEDTLARWVR